MLKNKMKFLSAVLFVGFMTICPGMKAQNVTPGKIINGVVYTGIGVAILGGSICMGLEALKSFYLIFSSDHKTLLEGVAELRKVKASFYNGVCKDSDRTLAAEVKSFLSVRPAFLIFMGYVLLKLGTCWIDKGLIKVGILKAESQPELSKAFQYSNKEKENYDEKK